MSQRPRRTSSTLWLPAPVLGVLGLVGLLAWTPSARAQARPYIGFVYPAGGQQGTTFQVRLGGQGLDGINSVIVTGSGVTARVIDYYWRLETQELQLLGEQLSVLRRQTMSAVARDSLREAEASAMTNESPTMLATATNQPSGPSLTKEAARELIDRIERRTSEYVPAPACAAIASIVMVEVTVAPDADPGEREIRLVTLKGVSNPLAFYAGQLPEVTRKPMVTAAQQVLGKEAQALRKRTSADEQEKLTLPCTVNGQISSSEVARYRFQASQGQRLVITTLGRQLVPFIADAVPGWFQPVLALYDSNGKEVAYDDDYRFKPDPTILYEVPRDGEYSFAIYDSLYRGREDFVYRVTIGELPFITSVFPLGRRSGTPVKPELKGWNLTEDASAPLPLDEASGTHWLKTARRGLISNRVPFAEDQLPEAFEREPNNTAATAQKVTLPVIINGRIDQPDDRDVFRFEGRSNDTVVAEVWARRLDSPLDSVIKLTDEAGTVLAFNDDHEDLTAGLNTHQADSYFTAQLPADGTYFVHISDTARQGGEEYGYRLRLSAPRPEFDLRVVPSSLGIRSKASGTLSVYAQRKDGFTGPIQLTLADPPEGFSATPVTMSATQSVVRLTIKTSLASTHEPVSLAILGTATNAGQVISHPAVPAEDQMQAFLWRQLVPARDLRVLVFDPSYEPPPARLARARPQLLSPASGVAVADAASGTNAALASKSSPEKPKITAQQVAGRLREIKRLFEAGLLTDDFYQQKVMESESTEVSP